MNPEPETSSYSLMHLVTKQEHFSSEQADNPRKRKEVFVSKQNPKAAPRQQSLSSFSSPEPVVSFGLRVVLGTRMSFAHSRKTK